MAIELSESPESDSSPPNSPDSAKTESETEISSGNGVGLSLSSFSPVKSFSRYTHWSQPWSNGGENDRKLYSGRETESSEPDWTDTWSLPNRRSTVSVSRRFGLDRKSSECETRLSVFDWLELQSDLKEDEVRSDSTELKSNTKENEVESETVQFRSNTMEKEVESETMQSVSSSFVWRMEEEEEEPAAVEDKLMGGGLVNLGNTCYLNSALQCFMHIVPLVQRIRASNHPSPCDACSEGFCVLCAVKELLNRSSLASKGSTIEPRTIVDNLSYISSSFQRFRQEDAHEFLQCFLNKLESCCNYPNLKRQVHSKHENVVKQTFGGHLISKLRCCNCGHCSNTREPVFDLSLEIEDVDSLNMALDSFTKLERVEDKKFRCEKCKRKVLIEKQLLLNETPLVSTFHLKRFKNDGSLIQKIDKHVTFPLELDLLPYVEKNHKVIVESKYNLVAVLVHVGLSSCSGHYYCFVHASPGAWYKYDDSKVTQVAEDFVMSQEAYIMFYVKQGTPWFSEFIETQQIIVDTSLSSRSPKSVLYNVSLTSNSSLRTTESSAADDTSANSFKGPKHHGIGSCEGKENLNTVSTEAEKTVKMHSLSVLREHNRKKELTPVDNSNQSQCTRKRRKRMEVSPVKDTRLPTNRRSKNSMGLRSLKASSLR